MGILYNRDDRWCIAKNKTLNRYYLSLIQVLKS
jgi:hypothetical protein